MLKRLPISILFHAILALVYLTAIVICLVFTIGNWFMVGASLIALIGLGILAALDVVIIRRKVNQRAFQAIEIVVLMVIVVAIMIGTLYEPYGRHGAEVSSPSNIITEIVIACIVSAPSVIYVLYICVAAIIDNARINALRPSHHDWQAQSSSGTRKQWCFTGTPRTPVERAAVVNRCASYIFEHSVFRKHSFEPTGWAILRGVLAVYSCIGILIFSGYSGYSEVQIYTSISSLQETVTRQYPPLALTGSTNPWKPLSVAATTNNMVWYTTPGELVITSSGGKNTILPPNSAGIVPFFNHDWAIYTVDFNVSWNSSVPLTLFITAADVLGDLQSIQYGWTNGFTLAPFKNYSISLAMVVYTIGTFSWVSFEPDLVDSVPSGSNDTTAAFSIDTNQRIVTQRTMIPPSAFIGVAHVLSDVGGTFAFIDGVFALIFGRTIMAILFGNRAISPFGLLGIVTRNRFKKLIHEQFPRIQKDIEQGGLAAYISEVAIDAALIDKPTGNGKIGSSPNSHTGHEAEEGRAISMSMGHLRGRSSVSHLQLPYVVEELQGDLDKHSLLSKRSNGE